jgi:sec-independent protein translocase protein TatA
MKSGEADFMREVPMFGLGPSELIVVGVILFVLFGAKRLPDIGKGLGGAIREFKKVKKDLSLSEDDGAPKRGASPSQQKLNTPDENHGDKAEAPGSKKPE